MRIVKEYEERRREILDTAEVFFITKGYSVTTIGDIIQAVNIAKGTFYHYFKSKEEVMEAVVMRFIETEIQAAKDIAGDLLLSAPEKLFRIICGSGKSKENKDKMIEATHKANNVEMHQKTIVESVLRLSPIISGVVEQGIEEGVFATQYPKETVEFLLAGSSVLLDDGIFHWKPAELLEKVNAFSVIMETTLGAEKGSFSYLRIRYEEMLQHKSDSTL